VWVGALVRTGEEAIRLTDNVTVIQAATQPHTRIGSDHTMHGAQVTLRRVPHHAGMRRCLCKRVAHLYSCATRGLLTAMLSTFSSSSDRSELNSSLHSTAQHQHDA
jgi:hypothetical protein